MTVHALIILLFTLLLATAVAVVLLRNLFAAVMLTGVFSLLSASLFLVMDAVDVAFTEAAVGAGIATVLMLGTLTMIETEERPSARPQWLPLVAVAATAACLLYATADMPYFGDPSAPAHQHVAPRYIEQSPKEIGIPNLVTAVLASYRGFDTLGEVVVVFTAGLGVLLLLGRPTGRKRNEEREEGSP